MARVTNRFVKGQSVFSCQCCKRKTRQTGGDNDSLRLCEECYEMGGIENYLQDHPGAADEKKQSAEWHRLKARCIAKGGLL